MKENKMAIHYISSLNLSFIFFLKSHTQNYNPTSLRKRMGGGWEVCPTTLLKLPSNWVICMKRVAPTTLLKLLQYWAICIGNIVN